MASFPLLHRQKKLLAMLKPYIEQELIQPTWTVFEHSSDAVAIEGLDDNGELDANGWIDVKGSDIRKFVELGLLRPIGSGRYDVDFMAILDAIDKKL